MILHVVEPLKSSHLCELLHSILGNKSEDWSEMFDTEGFGAQDDRKHTHKRISPALEGIWIDVEDPF